LAITSRQINLVYLRLTSPTASATAAPKNTPNSTTVEQILTILACMIN
jgi:hypothetical protein